MSKQSSRFECSDEKRRKIKTTKTMTSLRRQNQICKVYECKIVSKRLNKKQKEELEMMFVESKWFYNHILSMKKNGQKLRDINSTDVKIVKHFDKDKNEIKTELSHISSQQKQAIISRMISNEKTIASLIKNKFQNHGQLQFKSEINCVPLKQYGNTYSFKSANKVRIAGISGKLLVKTGGQLENADELANANLIKKPDGYYLKITTFINKENFNEKKPTKGEIGVDFGIKNNIITSEGEKIDISVEESDRLKKLQKELFRRVKGSNNRNKTINLIKREYQKLLNKKQDKANKLISKLKCYSSIVIQDEQIANWHKGWFGKQIQHSCMGLVKAKLKSLPQTVVLDKFIPTTKWCPICHKKNNVSLDDRIYFCSCGYSEDRDVHSAKNMLTIKNLVFEKHNFVPTEHREITLTEFMASIDDKSTSPNDEVRRCKVFSLA
jgi:transposase